MHTNYSCLAAADVGISYNWAGRWAGVNYAVWNGRGDGHCHACKLEGKASEWKYTAAPGAWSYPLKSAAAQAETLSFRRAFDANLDGVVDALDLRRTQVSPDLP